MLAQIRLRLLPSARCLFDEPVQVKVAGLRSKQMVTLRARSTDEKGVVFNSSASYRANARGEIDLNRDASLSGSYVGVEPMGLLRSLKADALHKYFNKDRALEPFMVNFSVHEEEGRMLAEATNERRLMGDGVRRVSIKEGNIQGVLFTPPGEGPFPAVLDLGTFMSEKRASLLANKGFIVLAVSLFTNRPKLDGLNLDGFEEAVKFLQNQPKDFQYGKDVFHLGFGIGYVVTTGMRKVCEKLFPGNEEEKGSSKDESTSSGKPPRLGGHFSGDICDPFQETAFQESPKRYEESTNEESSVLEQTSPAGDICIEKETEEAEDSTLVSKTTTFGDSIHEASPVPGNNLYNQPNEQSCLPEEFLLKDPAAIKHVPANETASLLDSEGINNQD